jgi:hypothetical protein
MKTLKKRLDDVVGQKVTVHYCVRSPSGDIQPGKFPAGKKESVGRFKIACGIPFNGGNPLFAASGETHIVNCPDCKNTEEFLTNYVPRPNVRYDQIDPSLRKQIEALEAKRAEEAAAKNPLAAQPKE